MQTNTNPKVTRSPLITNIEVVRLFGRYNYNLDIPSAEPGTVSKMAMIYGDNGTGKTTILKLLFHLISPSQNRGHRSFISHVPFSRFSVSFSDETKIEAIRKGSNLMGSYAIGMRKAKRHKLKGEINPDSDGRVTSQSVSPEAERIINELSRLGLSVFFLGDDRQLQSDEFDYTPEELHLVQVRDYASEAGRELGRRGVVRTAAVGRDIALRRSLEETATWLRRRSILASTRGEAEAQQIYANIVERINRIGVPTTEVYISDKDKLIEELEKLDKRSKSFERFGLMLRIDATRFIKGLDATTKEGIPFISQVISSFIDGQKARLDTLEELYKVLDRFVRLINGFLRDKHLIFEVREGISIMTDSGDRLMPENLSSGEKQLLLLFCNVIAWSEASSLFLIDEPEISLNVKWQRRLIDSLIDITQGSQCQFLFATHSIELLAKHRDQTIKLDPR